MGKLNLKRLPYGFILSRSDKCLLILIFGVNAKKGENCLKIFWMFSPYLLFMPKGGEFV